MPTDEELAWAVRIAARFRSLASRDAPRATPAAPDEWVSKLRSVDRARIRELALCASSSADVELHLRLALDEAWTQAGERGASILLDGVGAISRWFGGGRLLHGTSSWALRRILEDGEVRPAGDGLTGEVAITGVVDPCVYVCEATGPMSLYAAATFAYSNADRSGEELTLSAVRNGRAWLVDRFDELLFGEGAPRVEEGARRAAVRMVRHRTLELDVALAAALETAIERLRAGTLPENARGLRRSVGRRPEESAFVNLLCSIESRSMGGARAGRRVAAESLPAAVARLVPELRRSLLCPMPEDDEATLAEKAATLDALRAQFACILVLDSERLPVRSPSYSWTGERLVDGSIALDRLAAVYAPLDQRDEVRRALDRAGLPRAEVLPLEWVEALRMLAEPARPRAP